jgi:hypothetical protein
VRLCDVLDFSRKSSLAAAERIRNNISASSPDASLVDML